MAEGPSAFSISSLITGSYLLYLVKAEKGWKRIYFTCQFVVDAWRTGLRRLWQSCPDSARMCVIMTCALALEGRRVASQQNLPSWI